MGSEWKCSMCGKDLPDNGEETRICEGCGWHNECPEPGADEPEAQ